MNKQQSNEVAVNAHEELLAAAKRALSYIRSQKDGLVLDWEHDLEKAIAKAEGK